MPLELSEVVSKALARGFQIESEAFSLLSHLPLDVDGEILIEKVIQRRISMMEERLITKEDLWRMLQPEMEVAVGSAVVVGKLKSEVEVLNDPTERIAPAEAEVGFKKLFADRYERLLNIAKRRPDLKGLPSIQSVSRVNQKQRIKVGGLLSSRSSRKGMMEVVLDDPSGSTRAVCVDEASDSVVKVPLDCFVVLEGSKSHDGVLFANSVTLPDIPVRKPVTSSHRVYAALLSDLHVGSRMFLEEDFRRFILWLNGKLGETDLVAKVRYVIIAGDVVDGVGVYPGQEYQLSERNLKKQYALASELIGQIPKSMQVFVSPGNHDSVRQALPQPAISNDVAESLHGMENVKLLGNPCYLKLHGVTFLIYHGRSLDDIIASVPGLSYSRPAGAMQVLLKARHLAPTYGKRTALSPELMDMLVIDPVPDVFHAGHVHAVDVVEYRGTLIANSGTWQGQTPFQVNMGLEPTPSIVPLVDLSTMEVLKRSFTRDGFS
jgi:DNA polymerase II small subunit